MRTLSIFSKHFFPSATCVMKSPKTCSPNFTYKFTDCFCVELNTVSDATSQSLAICLLPGAQDISVAAFNIDNYLDNTWIQKHFQCQRIAQAISMLKAGRCPEIEHDQKLKGKDLHYYILDGTDTISTRRLGECSYIMVCNVKLSISHVLCIGREAFAWGTSGIDCLYFEIGIWVRYKILKRNQFCLFCSVLFVPCPQFSCYTHGTWCLFSTYVVCLFSEF